MSPLQSCLEHLLQPDGEAAEHPVDELGFALALGSDLSMQQSLAQVTDVHFRLHIFVRRQGLLLSRQQYMYARIVHGSQLVYVF